MQRKDLVLRRLPGRPDFGKQGWEVVIPRQVTLGIKECIMAFKHGACKELPNTVFRRVSFGFVDAIYQLILKMFQAY